MLGFVTKVAVEWDQEAREVLFRRQIDGLLPPFPVWDDVQTFNGKPWRGKIDLVSGGFPCQDISAAGRGAGIEGEKSSMWREMARIIGEIRPRFVFVENSPLLVQRGLGLVLLDLAKLGFISRWGIVGAGDVGQSHRRNRFWLLARHSERGIGVPDRLDQGH
ncbi:MAG: DNA cytosine methyltransferase [Planctomycetota bacterium]